MANLLEPILSELNTTTVYIVIALMVVVILLAIIKKAFKITILAVIILVVTIILGQSASSFQEKYHINVDRDSISIVVEDKEFNLDASERLKECTIIYNGDQTATLMTLDENNETSYIKVPTFMLKTIEQFLDKNNMEYEVRD